MAPAVIIVHGGTWDKNNYEGGSKYYIPMPCGGINYAVLLMKIEALLKKDSSLYSFDILALVNSDDGEIMKLNVMDEFEWSFLKDMKEFPTLYVNARLKCEPCIPNRRNGELALDCLAVPTLNNSCVGSASHSNALSEWMKVGVPAEALLDIDEVMIQDESLVIGKLGLGSVFRSKDSMVSAVHSYHLKNLLEFRTYVSDSLRYYLRCKSALTCDFLLRSRSFGRCWRIYEFVAHNCVKDLRKVAEARVTSRSIAEYVAPKMTADGFQVRPIDIQGQLLQDFGVRVKYPTALAGRNRALKSMFGDEDHSFQMVAKYLYMLQQMNPGSVVDLQTCENSSFEYCFFSLAASIRAFRVCRPVIVIDATHLKGRYKGVLFVATTKDANEQIVPLAFGVGDKENDSSWTWFLQNVRNSFGSPANLLIVSDQHKSISNSVEVVYPGIAHGLCTYHIQGNLRTNLGKEAGDTVIDMFHAAANAYREEDFMDYMSNLEGSAPKVHAKLMSIDPKRWAACRCPVRRYAYGTSNAVESLNGRLKWGRKLPITSLLEHVRNIMQSWFYKRRTKAEKRGIEVSEYAEKRLGYVVAKGNSYRVEPITDLKFNIISGSMSNIVDLGMRQCSCKIFQMDLFPCSHATAAIRFKNETVLSYVHSYYSTATWRAVYASEVMPLPPPCEWKVPTEIESIFVGTPKNPKQAGRPKTKRIPSVKEGLHLSTKEVLMNDGTTEECASISSRVCCRCKGFGHYASTCNAVIEVIQGEAGCSSKTSMKRRRNTKKCGICGVAGHTRQTCKDDRRLE